MVEESELMEVHSCRRVVSWEQTPHIDFVITAARFRTEGWMFELERTDYVEYSP